MKSRTRLVGIALVGLLTGIAASLLYSRYDYSHRNNTRAVVATVLQPPKALHPFMLTDAHNNRFNRDKLRGHWSFLFFGYTYCPDICPTTLSVMREARMLIEERGEPMPYFYFISVDPERDAPERITNYTTYFDTHFVGIAPTLETLPQLTGQLGVRYVKVENRDSAGYLMDHTASVYLIDPAARFQALFSLPHDPSVIAADFAAIVEKYE